MNILISALAAFALLFMHLRNERWVCGERLHYEVVRSTDFADDALELPSEKCSSSSEQCSNYNAKKLNNCSCFCGRDKSTFYEPMWKCIGNQEVREKEACNMLFVDEKATDPLRVLTNEGNPSAALLKFNTTAEECKLTFHRGLTGIKGCDGNWRNLSSCHMRKAFSYTSKWSSEKVSLQLSKVAKYVRMVEGGLIKLAVQCRPKSGNGVLNTSCVLFKVKGTLQCCRREFGCQPSKTTPGTVAPSTTPSPTSVNPGVADARTNKSPTRKIVIQKADSSVLGYIFGVGVAVVITVILIIALYLMRKNKKKKKSRNSLMASIRVPRVNEGLNYDQPIIPHATDKSCFGNPTYQRGEDKSIVIKKGRIDTKSLLNRNLQLSAKLLAEQSNHNNETRPQTEELVNLETTASTETDEKPAGNDNKKETPHQYEVPESTLKDDPESANSLPDEKYNDNISPYCVTYFGKNAKARLLKESAERKGGRHVYEEPEQTISDDTN